MNDKIQSGLEFLAKSQPNFINLVRISIFIVMVWIGGLKAFQYEADGIVHFVSNSPFMSFLYNNSNKTVEIEVQNPDGTTSTKTVKEYTQYKNPEGKMVAKNIEWHKSNGTYPFSYGLGTAIVVIGTLTLLGIWFSKVGLLGGLLTFGMSLVTLSFLVTTPEAWVPNLGGDMPTPQHGFPYLSGVGRLVIKDIIMLAGGLVAASDCAMRILKKQKTAA